MEVRWEILGSSCGYFVGLIVWVQRKKNLVQGRLPLKVLAILILKKIDKIVIQKNTQGRKILTFFHFESSSSISPHFGYLQKSNFVGLLYVNNKKSNPSQILGLGSDGDILISALKRKVPLQHNDALPGSGKG